MNNSVDLTYKLSIFGVKGVGKTTLIHRYITNIFDVNVKSTLGAAIHVKYLKIDNKTVLIQIWDFGGEEKYRFLLPSYAYGTFGAIFMYDTTNKETLNNFKEWISIFKSGLREDKLEIPILLVGGKTDLLNQRSCYKEDLEKIIQSNLFFNIMECSSKTGENVDKVFRILLEEIMKRISLIE